MVLDDSDYSALSSSTARGLLSSSSGYLGMYSEIFYLVFMQLGVQEHGYTYADAMCWLHIYRLTDICCRGERRF